MTNKKNIMCVKWGSMYGPEYVNIMYSMVARNITGPFRFICLTDNTAGIRKEVETFPIPDASLKGWWSKIAFFKNPLYNITGPLLTIDLDMIIINNIDCFFDYKPGEFIMKEDYKTHGHSSCIMRFNANEHGHIYENLNLDKLSHSIDNLKKDFKKKKYWGDQIWITEQINKDPLKRKVYNWPTKWLVKFALDCHIDPRTNKNIERGYQSTGITLDDCIWKSPKNAKIIIFSGIIRIEDNIDKIGKWWFDE